MSAKKTTDSLRYPSIPSAEDRADFPGDGISRRRFVGGASVATAALMLPWWRASAAEAAATCWYALNPVRPILGVYVPPKAVLALDRDTALEFDLLGWSNTGGTRDLKIAQMNIGTLKIERKAEARKVTYHINRLCEGDNMDGTLVCLPGDIETVQSWTARWHRTDFPAGMGSILEKSGSVEGGQIIVKEANGERKQPCPAVVVSDASIFFNPTLIERLAGLKEGFARIDQTLVPRREQQVRAQGAVTPPLGATNAEAWLLTGHGTLPTHFVRDAEKLPLFLTGMLSSCALKSIS